MWGPAGFPRTLIDSGLSLGKARKAVGGSGLSLHSRLSLLESSLTPHDHLLLLPEWKSHWVPGLPLLKPKQKPQCPQHMCLQA